MVSVYIVGNDISGKKVMSGRCFSDDDKLLAETIIAFVQDKEIYKVVITKSVDITP